MRTEMVATGINDRHSDVASAEEIRGAFVSHREQLGWLAEFLTNDNEVAQACVIDASTTAAAEGEISQDWLFRWTRLATISSAIGVQELRVAQLAAMYERRACAHPEHRRLSTETIEFVVKESELIQSRLDALCRFALIMCGVERFSSHEAAVLLGVSTPAVKAAYCVAVELVEIVHCQALIECGCCAAA